MSETSFTGNLLQLQTGLLVTAMWVLKANDVSFLPWCPNSELSAQLSVSLLDDMFLWLQVVRTTFFFMSASTETKSIKVMLRECYSSARRTENLFSNAALKKLKPTANQLTCVLPLTRDIRREQKYKHTTFIFVFKSLLVSTSSLPKSFVSWIVYIKMPIKMIIT